MNASELKAITDKVLIDSLSDNLKRAIDDAKRNGVHDKTILSKLPPRTESTVTLAVEAYLEQRGRNK